MVDDIDPRRRAPAADAGDVSVARILDGAASQADLSIRRDSLERQASRAEVEGYPQLARNFRRAAELTAIPDDVLLATYEKLRPQRASYGELLALAQEIAARYDAPETGAMIREAAEAYREKGLLRPDRGTTP
jgi:propanediol dehydratase small subunit